MTIALSSADAIGIADVVQRLPEISRLSGGTVGEVATYLPGHRVTGVRIREAGVEVHVVAASMTTPLPVVADRVRRAVLDRFPAATGVDVAVDDIEQAPVPEPLPELEPVFADATGATPGVPVL